MVFIVRTVKEARTVKVVRKRKHVTHTVHIMRDYNHRRSSDKKECSVWVKKPFSFGFSFIFYL